MPEGDWKGRGPVVAGKEEEMEQRGLVECMGVKAGTGGWKP